LYKATSVLDGRCYVLRRVSACRPTVERLHEAMEPWIDLQRQHSPSGGGGGNTASVWAKEVGAERGDMEGHPALVAMRRSFNTTEFGDGGGT